MNFWMLKLVVQTLKYASLVLCTLMLHSCDDDKRSSYINEEASASIPGLPFDIERALFLNQYTNPTSRTTSWLLADSGFIQNQSLDAVFSVGQKSKLCILHWSQTDDPVWIGARIPGQFLGADLLRYEGDTLVIRQYKTNGIVVTANELYKNEITNLLKEVNTVRYP